MRRGGRERDREEDREEPMVRAGYTVTEAQHRWLKRAAVDLNTDASAVLRGLIHAAMQVQTPTRSQPEVTP